MESGTAPRRLIADVNVLKRAENDAIGHRSNECSAVPGRGCQRTAGGQVTRLVTRQRIRHERYIADVNVLDAAHGDAMNHRGTVVVRMLRRRCQRTASGAE